MSPAICEVGGSHFSHRRDTGSKCLILKCLILNLVSAHSAMWPLWFIQIKKKLIVIIPALLVNTSSSSFAEVSLRGSMMTFIIQLDYWHIISRNDFVIGHTKFVPKFKLNFLSEALCYHTFCPCLVDHWKTKYQNLLLLFIYSSFAYIIFYILLLWVSVESLISYSFRNHHFNHSPFRRQNHEQDL